MTRQSTLPGLREQARHALLLLGVPAPARLVVDVHAAFFDGDLSVPSLAALIRDDERANAAKPAPDGESVSHHPDIVRPYLICPALDAELAPSRGTVALSTWSLDERLITPAVARAHLLVATVRIAEFAAAHPGASARELLQRLAADVPGGFEASSLADAAREALEDPALAAAAAADEPARAAALARAGLLDDHHRLYGLPSLPHQRGGA